MSLCVNEQRAVCGGFKRFPKRKRQGDVVVEQRKGVFCLLDIGLTRCLPGIQVSRERASTPPPVLVSANSLIDGGVETTGADLSSACRAYACTAKERISIES